MKGAEATAIDRTFPGRALIGGRSFYCQCPLSRRKANAHLQHIKLRLENRSAVTTVGNDLLRWLIDAYRDELLKLAGWRCQLITQHQYATQWLKKHSTLRINRSPRCRWKTKSACDTCTRQHNKGCTKPTAVIKRSSAIQRRHGIYLV